MAPRRTGRKYSHRSEGETSDSRSVLTDIWRIRASKARREERPEKLSRDRLRSRSAMRTASADGAARGGGKEGGRERRNRLTFSSHPAPSGNTCARERVVTRGGGPGCCFTTACGHHSWRGVRKGRACPWIHGSPTVLREGPGTSGSSTAGARPAHILSESKELNICSGEWQGMVGGVLGGRSTTRKCHWGFGAWCERPQRTCLLGAKVIAPPATGSGTLRNHWSPSCPTSHNGGTGAHPLGSRGVEASCSPSSSEMGEDGTPYRE